MPTPWQTGESLQDDLEGFKPEAEWFLELKVNDEHGNPQGEVLVGVWVESTKSRHGGWQVLAAYLSASDEYYRWWMSQGDGKAFATKGCYHLCGGTVESCGALGSRHIHVHVGRSRRVLEEELTSRKVTWLRNEAKEVFESNVAKFYATLRRGPARPGRAGDDPGAIQVGEPRHGRDDDKDRKRRKKDDSSSGSSATSAGMKERLKKLRAELAEAEKERDDKKGKGAKHKKKAHRKRKREGHAKVAKHEKRSRGRSEKKKESKKERKRGKSPDSGSGSRKKERKKRKKGEKGKSSSSAKTTSREERVTLFQPAGAAGKQVLDGGDRGPFGGGSAVDFDGSSSSEESSFRKGSSVSAKSSQMRLVRYAERHPGRLASRLLLKMQEATARGALEPTNVMRSLTPAVAQNHLLTVLLPSLGEKTGVRTRRELKTLTKVLDSLARGDPAGAADVVAQRVKALERASHEAHWGTAQYLELLPPENTTLLDRAEENFVTAQYLVEQKLKSYDNPERGGPRKGARTKMEREKMGRARKERGQTTTKRTRRRRRAPGFFGGRGWPCGLVCGYKVDRVAGCHS